jgi:hypothetical protein
VTLLAEAGDPGFSYYNACVWPFVLVVFISESDRVGKMMFDCVKGYVHSTAYHVCMDAYKHTLTDQSMLECVHLSVQVCMYVCMHMYVCVHACIIQSDLIRKAA